MQTVLLVEDDDISQMIATHWLQQEGFQVTQATSGKEALEKIEQQEAFSLILMDLNMPMMGGIEATKHIRAKGIETPIIALTAHADQEQILALEAAGMNGHLIKPFDPDKLKHLIQTHLQ